MPKLFVFFFPADWTLLQTYRVDGATNSKYVVAHSCGTTKTVWSSNLKHLSCPACKNGLTAPQTVKILKGTSTKGFLPSVLFASIPLLTLDPGDELLVLHKDGVYRYLDQNKSGQVAHLRLDRLTSERMVVLSMSEQAWLAQRKIYKRIARTGETEELAVLQQVQDAELLTEPTPPGLPDLTPIVDPDHPTYAGLPIPQHYIGFQEAVVCPAQYAPWFDPHLELDPNYQGEAEAWARNAISATDLTDVMVTLGASFTYQGKPYTWLYVEIDDGITIHQSFPDESFHTIYLEMMEQRNVQPT